MAVCGRSVLPRLPDTMEARVIVVCLFVAAIVRGDEAPVGSLCRPNERLLMCGCPRTCRDPAPDCAAVCRAGCFCEPGQVRNDEGLCVKLADCPPILSAYKQDTTEPRPNEGKCRVNEEYRFCEPCNKTCDNPNPICPAQCSRGCFCKDGLLRDRDGTCVAPEKCLNSQPQATFGPMVHDFQPSLHDATVEDCAPDEEFYSCGWCEPSCSDPYPSCPKEVCTRGCLCRPPLLRHHSGACVHAQECNQEKCLQSNEEFVCLFGCELRCDNHCVRPRYCVFGCYCKIGYLRDNNGLCVHKNKCSNSNNTDVNDVADGLKKNVFILMI